MTTAGKETTQSLGVLVEHPCPESYAFFQRGITAPPVDLRPTLHEVRSSRRHWGTFSPYTELAQSAELGATS